MNRIQKRCDVCRRRSSTILKLETGFGRKRKKLKLSYWIIDIVLRRSKLYDNSKLRETITMKRFSGLPFFFDSITFNINYILHIRCVHTTSYKKMKRSTKTKFWSWPISADIERATQLYETTLIENIKVLITNQSVAVYNLIKAICESNCENKTRTQKFILFLKSRNFWCCELNSNLSWLLLTSCY